MGWLWLLPSVIVGVLVILGPLLSHLEWVEPEQGFRLYVAGIVLAALSAGVCAGAAALASALGRAWRRQALRAAVLPMVVAFLSVAPSLGRPRWPFNDVSTDLSTPPVFVTGPAAGIPYPEAFASPQRQTFPDVEGGVRLALPPPQALQEVERLARSTAGWEVVHVDPRGGLVQAVAVSRVFRFRDDVIIRVRPEGGGSRVDLRSRSRVGRSDLGANSDHIQAFAGALLRRLSGPR